MNTKPDTIHIASKNDILLNSLFMFYKGTDYIEKILPIINGQSIISLRLLDWFATNYSKKNNVIYNVGVNKNVIFNVHLDYKLQLKAYNKKYFDPFCRKNRILFEYKDKLVVKTTVGQLNFFRWALKNEIITYVTDNLADIAADMNSIYQIKKKERTDSESDSTERTSSDKGETGNIISNSSNDSDIPEGEVVDSEDGKRMRRKELSHSATKTINKHNISVTLNFD